MLLIIDNYDSFTFNLVQYFRELGAEVLVKRNDELTVDEVFALSPSQIVISPGPCTPNEAGISLALVEENLRRDRCIPLLGVCLGHQTIVQVCGGDVVSAENVMHGKTSEIEHEGDSVFAGLPSPMTVTRYHSLIAKGDNLPNVLRKTAWTQTNEIMAVQHEEYPIVGVQFHPEAILTQHGYKMLNNFMNIV